jgi:hypothetical protein
MRKVATSRILFISALLFTGLSFVSFAAFKQANSVRTCIESECKREKPQKTGDMFWDALSRQFVSHIFFR